MLARRVIKTFRRRWAESRLERMGLVRAFEGYPPDAIRPKYHQLYALYRLVSRRRPATILELGGGYSTFVLAKAALDLAGRGVPIRVFSVDESEHWQAIVREHMPAELQRAVSFHRSEVVDLGGGRGFASLPVESANFIYLDGGGIVSPVRLEENAPPDYAILIDGRQSTVAFLKDNLKLDYRIIALDAGSQTLFARRR
jgi:hypothetical protein